MLSCTDFSPSGWAGLACSHGLALHIHMGWSFINFILYCSHLGGLELLCRTITFPASSLALLLNLYGLRHVLTWAGPPYHYLSWFLTVLSGPGPSYDFLLLFALFLSDLLFQYLIMLRLISGPYDYLYPYLSWSPIPLSRLVLLYFYLAWLVHILTRAAPSYPYLYWTFILRWAGPSHRYLESFFIFLPGAAPFSL